MSDLIDDDSKRDNAPEFSVTELSGAIKRVIEGEFAHVRLRGEVGRVARPRSGHLYLDLKDDRAVIAGVIWKGVAGRLTTQPEEGMEVIATGRVTTFGGQSKYQIVIEDIQPAGQGALMAMLEQRKKKLAAEGLFEQGHKRQLPFLPEVIGVVTSPSGAVIRDILHRLRERFPRKVLIWPVAVQGAACAPEVARAIRGFNALGPGGAVPRPDVLIVARGGGSIEDLWGFNEEDVARAAFASEIPLISAVGHETDTTLIDFVSDRRAPTPSAAAEIAVPVRMDLLTWLDGQSSRLVRALTGTVNQRGQRLRDLSRAVPRADRLLDGPRQRLDTWADKLPAALVRTVQLRQVRLSNSGGALRPGLLRRAVKSDARRLRDTAARLNLHALRSDLRRRASDLENITQRLHVAAQRQTWDWRKRLDAIERLRETLGYEATLARGYVVVRGDGQVQTRKAGAEKASALELQFADGRLRIGGRTSARKSKRSDDIPPEQGSLL